MLPYWLKKPSIVCLLAGILLIPSGCAFNAERNSGAQELIEPAGVRIHTVPAERGDLTDTWNGVGTVVPLYTDYAHFTIDGTLEYVGVQPGDRVTRGQELFRLDDGNGRLALLQQQLAFENMQAALASVIAAGGSEDDIVIARLNVEIERLKLQRLRDRQDKLTIVAPSDGIVTFLEDVRAGGPVAAYRNLVGIARTDALQVAFIGDLTGYASRLFVGMPVKLSIDGVEAEGRLSATPWTLGRTSDNGAAPTSMTLGQTRRPGANAAGPSVTPSERNASLNAVSGKTLLIDFAHVVPEGVTIGDYVEFEIVLSEKQDVVIIPRGALRNNRGGYFVRVYEDGQVRDVNVRPGIITAIQAEITEGIAPGQQIVVNP